MNIDALGKVAVELYFDSDGVKGGKQGCYRARLKYRHEVHDAGESSGEAFDNLVITAVSHGYPAVRTAYFIEVLTQRPQ